MASSGRPVMESGTPHSHSPPQADPEIAETWEARERDWQRRLGRLRLGAEPLEEQLARYRRATWVLTDIALGLALMFLGLFAAFHRPDVGGILALVLLAPVVALAWIDYGRMVRLAARYRSEFQEHRNRMTNPGRT